MQINTRATYFAFYTENKVQEKEKTIQSHKSSIR